MPPSVRNGLAYQQAGRVAIPDDAVVGRMPPSAGNTHGLARESRSKLVGGRLRIVFDKRHVRGES